MAGGACDGPSPEDEEDEEEKVPSLYLQNGLKIRYGYRETKRKRRCLLCIEWSEETMRVQRNEKEDEKRVFSFSILFSLSSVSLFPQDSVTPDPPRLLKARTPWRIVTLMLLHVMKLTYPLTFEVSVPYCPRQQSWPLGGWRQGPQAPPRPTRKSRRESWAPQSS